jgi:membrane protein insertase Oxa1/YidC/SpoIIIJ
MWQDLAALTPPLVMCVAIIIGVVLFLRHEMGPKRRGTDTDDRPPREPRS